MVTMFVQSGSLNRSTVSPPTTRCFQAPKGYKHGIFGPGANINTVHISHMMRASSNDENGEGTEETKEETRSFGEAFGNELKNFFDFANWAPRSSQAWRLGGLDSSSVSSSADEDSMTEENLEVLNERMAEQRRSLSGSLYDEEEDLEETGPMEPSFLRSTDEEFAESLNARITEVATGSHGPTDDDEEEESFGLDGDTLLGLIEAKYGKKHDVAFVRRDIPGKTLVSLNIYHAYLGQKSFPMSEDDFKEKMDGVALSLIMWDQVDTVVGFLKSPIRSQRGLPSRPIVGNAVSISLELTKEQILEWWGR